MDDKVSQTLDLLAADMLTTWVRDELQASFAEGITEKVSEQAKSSGYVSVVEPMALREARKEQTKRESYETTRPYTADEQLDLLEFALTQVFVALPAVRTSTTSFLRKLAPSLEAVEFLSDQDEAAAPRHRHDLVVPGTPNPDLELTASVRAFMRKVRDL